MVKMGEFFVECGGNLLEGDVLHAVVGVGAISFFSGCMGGGLDDVVEALIGADDGGIGGAIETDEGRVEGGGEMERAGVVAEGEGRGFQQSEKLGQGGFANEVDERVLGVGDDLLGELFFRGACADEDGGEVMAVVDVVGELCETIGGPMFFGFGGADAEDDVRGSRLEAHLLQAGSRVFLNDGGDGEVEVFLRLIDAKVFGESP